MITYGTPVLGWWVGFAGPFPSLAEAYTFADRVGGGEPELVDAAGRTIQFN